MGEIRKVLVANRGEIAVRIIRSCQEMGIGTVAVYSDVDRAAPHVLMADEAYRIGAPVAAESYLKMDTLIQTARRCGADAIHPGYGFLAENAAFAQKTLDAGFIFIGPLPETIRLMGSKTESRKTMMAAGVPVVPGARESLETPEAAAQLVEQFGGYPILIKAAAGGGGKGMRIVRNEKEMPRAFAAARSEAQKAFGDPTVYIEKYIENPKHIEFQIIADAHGNVVHLWERDCSVQRRHQKVVEECPSVCLTAETRAAMGAVAVKAARACGYRNAGTVEFLYEQGNFYFLEMNTRLQVEHPVTEMVLGMDLVKLQLQVAAGHPLPFDQQAVQPRGHAIECRINAEDVFNHFVPTTGRITHLKYPDGPGVRVDSGIDVNLEISRFYDPMAAKLVVWAEDRPAAIQRMRRALGEFQIQGIKTTIPFCIRVLDHPDFLTGSYTTRFVENYWEELQQQATMDPALVEVMAAALAYHRDQRTHTGNAATAHPGAPPLSPWKILALKQNGNG